MDRKLFRKLAVLICVCLLPIAIVTIYGSNLFPSRADVSPTISSELPSDIPGGASDASLTEAATFAWQEFIALNWPAVEQTGADGDRDTADTSKKLGENTNGAPLVWETFRHKVEIYPGNQPTEYVPGPYDALPDYQYQNTIDPCPSVDTGSTPWVNLDENSEIGIAKMFAGEDPGEDGGKYAPMFLYLAKANRQEYDYVTNQGEYETAGRNRWNGISKSNYDNPKATPTTKEQYNAKFLPITQPTIDYMIANKDNAPPASSDKVSFPTGTIEIKSAWRKLSTGGGLNDDPSHFHTAPVRFYEPGSDGGATCYVDDGSNWGMSALHIIQKTPSAPYFIYATFSQADNIRDSEGNPVETAAGEYVGSTDAPLNPLTPNVISKPAQNYARLQEVVNSLPGKSLYYENDAGAGGALTQGPITVNKRENPIPPEIQKVNSTFQKAIEDYNAANGIENSPWQYYKLVNVQYVPIDKVPGVEYDGTSKTIEGDAAPIDIGSYYLANDVVETDYTLQKFSGALQNKNICSDYTGKKELMGDELTTCLAAIKDSGLCDSLNLTGDDLTKCQEKGKVPPDKAQGLMTDYVNPYYLVATDGTQQFADTHYKNVFYKGDGFNMGGCIGCHGNTANAGTDFSFILSGGSVLAPDAIDTAEIKAAISDNFTEFFAQ